MSAARRKNPKTGSTKNTENKPRKLIIIITITIIIIIIKFWNIYESSKNFSVVQTLLELSQLEAGDHVSSAYFRRKNEFWAESE